MAGINIGVGGAWKNMANLSVGVGGAWKQVQNVYIGVGGVWKLAWQYLFADAGPYSAERVLYPGPAVATVAINNDGSYSTTNFGGGNTTGTWLTGGTASQVDVYLSGTGDTPSGSALNTWLNCGTSRSWYLSSNAGIKSFNGTMQMRDASTLAVLDSQTCTISAESTP